MLRQLIIAKHSCGDSDTELKYQQYLTTLGIASHVDLIMHSIFLDEFGEPDKNDPYGNQLWEAFCKEIL